MYQAKLIKSGYAAKPQVGQLHVSQFHRQVQRRLAVVVATVDVDAPRQQHLHHLRRLGGPGDAPLWRP